MIPPTDSEKRILEIVYRRQIREQGADTGSIITKGVRVLMSVDFGPHIVDIGSVHIITCMWKYKYLRATVNTNYQPDIEGKLNFTDLTVGFRGLPYVGIEYLDWILSEDVGVSSRTIFIVMMDKLRHSSMYTSDVGDPPFDKSDFARCSRLLQAFPLWREELDRVSFHFPEWKELVKRWDEAEKMAAKIEQLERDEAYLNRGGPRHISEKKQLYKEFHHFLRTVTGARI